MPQSGRSDRERRLPRAVAWIIWLVGSLAGGLVVVFAVAHFI